MQNESLKGHERLKTKVGEHAIMLLERGLMRALQSRLSSCPLGNGHNQRGCLKGGGLTQRNTTYSAVKCTPLEQW